MLMNKVKFFSFSIFLCKQIQIFSVFTVLFFFEAAVLRLGGLVPVVGVREDREDLLQLQEGRPARRQLHVFVRMAHADHSPKKLKNAVSAARTELK